MDQPLIKSPQHMALSPKLLTDVKLREQQDPMKRPYDVNEQKMHIQRMLEERRARKELENQAVVESPATTLSQSANELSHQNPQQQRESTSSPQSTQQNGEFSAYMKMKQDLLTQVDKFIEQNNFKSSQKLNSLGYNEDALSKGGESSIPQSNPYTPIRQVASPSQQQQLFLSDKSNMVLVASPQSSQGRVQQHYAQMLDFNKFGDQNQPPPTQELKEGPQRQFNQQACQKSSQNQPPGQQEKQLVFQNSAAVSIQPQCLANKSLTLFQPFAEEEYQKKLSSMQELYASPLTRISEKSARNKGLNQIIGAQRVEDRLLDFGKQRDQYLKILKQHYESKYLEDVKDRPQINKKSTKMVIKSRDASGNTRQGVASFYEKELEFLHVKEENRQRLASTILETQIEEIQLSPKINKASRRMQRRVRDLHAWQDNVNMKHEEMRRLKDKEEEDQLRNLRSKSKAAKQSQKYLQNNPLYSPQGKKTPGKTPTKVEDRLLTLGSQTSKKIDEERLDIEKSIKKRMNSPEINKRSHSKKYSEKPFYERLYVLKDRNASSTQNLHLNDISRVTKVHHGDGDDYIDDFNDRNFIEREEYERLQAQKLRTLSPPAYHSHIPIDLLQPGMHQQQQTSAKYTPLRQSRSPSNRRSTSKSNHRRTSSQGKGNFGKQPDYNQNYKQSFHKNVLLKEWQYLPLYDRQVLWSKQKDHKTQIIRDEKELKEMKEATFQPSLMMYQKPLPIAQPAIFQNSSSFSRSESYSKIHANKTRSSQKSVDKSQHRDEHQQQHLYATTPSKAQPYLSSHYSSTVKYSPQALKGLGGETSATPIMSSMQRDYQRYQMQYSPLKNSQQLEPQIYRTSIQSEPKYQPVTQQNTAPVISSEYQALRLGDDYYLRMYQGTTEGAGSNSSVNPTYSVAKGGASYL